MVVTSILTMERRGPSILNCLKVVVASSLEVLTYSLIVPLSLCSIMFNVGTNAIYTFLTQRTIAHSACLIIQVHKQRQSLRPVPNLQNFPILYLLLL